MDPRGRERDGGGRDGGGRDGGGRGEGSSMRRERDMGGRKRGWRRRGKRGEERGEEEERRGIEGGERDERLHLCVRLSTYLSASIFTYLHLYIHPSIYLEHHPPPLPAVYLVLSRGSNCCSDTESAIRRNPMGIGEREREGEEVQSEKEEVKKGRLEESQIDC